MTYNNPYDGAKENTPEGLDFFWSRLPEDYWSQARLDFCALVATEIDEFLRPSALIADGLVDLDRQTIRILEVGCGDGHVTRAVFDTYPQLKLDAIGIDYSGEAVKLAGKLVPEATAFVQWDILKSGFVGGNDLVLCIEALEHIADYELALANMVELVAPGGYLYITVPDGKTDTYAGHVNRFTPATLYEALLPHRQEGRTLQTGELVPGHYLYAVLEKGFGGDS